MNTQQLISQYEAHTVTIKSAGLHIKCIGNNLADVFSGEGFAAPTRLRKIKGKWAHLSGPKLETAHEVAVVTALS